MNFINQRNETHHEKEHVKIWRISNFQSCWPNGQYPKINPKIRKIRTRKYETNVGSQAWVDWVPYICLLYSKYCFVNIYLIYSGKRTEWSPIRSVIIPMITKSDDRETGVRFVNHEYDYRPTSDDTKSTYQLIIKITIFEKHKK